MADRLSTVTDRLEAAWESARARSFWLILVLATLGVIGVAVVAGSTAMLRADAWRTLANEVRATEQTVMAWREELVPPVPAESAAWENSRRAVRGLGIEGGDRIALMQLVAQRAEDLGLAPVSVAFAASDTLGIDAVREVGDVVLESAPYALHVRLRADYAGVGSFIGSLPPQVEVHRLEATRDTAGILTDLILVVFLEEGA
jgi:hypothetical protein